MARTLKVAFVLLFLEIPLFASGQALSEKGCYCGTQGFLRLETLPELQAVDKTPRLHIAPLDTANQDIQLAPDPSPQFCTGVLQCTPWSDPWGVIWIRCECSNPLSSWIFIGFPIP